MGKHQVTCPSCGKSGQIELPDGVTPAQVAEEVTKRLTPDFPTVSSFVEHCKTCPDHKVQFDNFLAQHKNQVLANITVEEAKGIARMHKLWPPPSIKMPFGIADERVLR